MLLTAACFTIWMGIDSRRTLASITRPQPPPDGAGFQATAATLSIAGSPTKGQAGIPIVLVQFADFQCRFCARFAMDVLPMLLQEYVDTGRLRLSFKHLPLKIHPTAALAARYAVCANMEGRFWSFHDSLFQLGSPQALDSAMLDRIVMQEGLGTSRFVSCLDGVVSQTALETDVGEAAALGIRSTPTFLLGRDVGGDRVKVLKTLVGTKAADVFREWLNAELGR
jgi:protein-disulfide isomerase